MKLIRIVAPVLVFLIMIVAVIASYSAKQAIQTTAKKDFEHDSKLLADTVASRMDNYSDLLYSGRAFILSRDNTTQGEWADFFNTQNVFERYRGVNAIGFAERVTNRDKQNFVAKMRALPTVDEKTYSITPPGDRQEYILVSKLLNSSTNTNSVRGLDLLSDSDRKMAIDNAAKTNTPQATAQIVFADGLQGFWIALPVNRTDKPQSYILVSFRTNELIDKILSDLDSPAFQIADKTPGDKEVSLYQSKDYQDKSDLKYVNTINVSGRSWQISFSGDADYGRALAHRILPLAIIIAGISFASLLLVTLSVFLRVDE